MIDFPDRAEGFLTLHMKWACGRMRAAVAQAVQKTVFSNKDTEDYALRSVTATSHPMAASTFLKHAQGLDSPSVQQFEDIYRSNLSYDASRGLWIGKHVTSTFVVDLLRQKTLPGTDEANKQLA
jgi:hypothetical protein